MNKGTAIVGFFLCFLAGMGLMWGVDRSANTGITAENGSATAALDQSDAPIPVTSKDPIWGDPNAPVTIVEISDFQCPFCKRVGPTMEQIKQTYGPKKVRVVWKNNPLPFHSHARPAADAAMTVFALGGNKAFWKYKALLFENQPNFDEDKFVGWAKQVGVDPQKFKAALDAKKYTSKVDDDLAFSKKVGANGTPNFRINGIEISGAQPYDKFKTVIDQQLAAAKQLIASGTKPANVYVALTKKNFKAPPQQAQNDQKPKEDTTIWKATIDKDNPVEGPSDALVTIVEFSDFQCPFCKRVEGTLKQVKTTYGKDVRIVWKNNPLPFHPRAKPAATVAWMAYKQKGNAAFWKVHDELFDSQPKLSDDDLKKIADENGLNWTQVKAAIDSDKYKDDFQKTLDEGSDLNARGTPHFFVNGYRITGAQPFSKFKEVIDAQLAKAKAMVAKGTPRAKVYDEIMKEAKGPPEPEKKDVPPPTAANPSKGNPNGKIVIQEWSDFQCPFCKRVEPTIQQLMKEHPGKIKFVWHNFPLPFHHDAPLAAEAAMEVFHQKGSAGFWKFHDALYESQPAIKRADLERIAQQMGGIDMAKFKKALDTMPYKDEIQKDQDVGKKAGISGTPAFVINGYFVSGAQPIGAFNRAIKFATKGGH